MEVDNVFSKENIFGAMMHSKRRSTTFLSYISRLIIGGMFLLIGSCTHRIPDIIQVVQRGDIKTLEEIVTKSPNLIDQQDKAGLTGLMWAAIMCKDDMLKFLAEKGANLKHRDKEDQTALMYVVSNKKCRDIERLIIEFSREKESIDMVNKQGYTALHIAVLENNTEAIKLLLKYGANWQIRDHNGKNALDIAKENGNKESISILNKEIHLQ
jgi:ankyrin repeat protein